jgi:pimeloyl-ACP methyl ester carboxylesterase
MAPRILAAFFLLIVAAQPAGAQDRVTVFLHGFNSDVASWHDTASRLAARLQIVSHVPSLPWHLPFDTQATQLHHEANAAGAPPNAVVVGHSNGGLVARQLSTKRALGGIVTLGSPHRGAPLARNIHGVTQHYLFTGQKLGLLLYMLGASHGTNQFTGIWFSPGLAPLRAAIATLGLALSYTVGTIEGSIGPIVTAPVLADMTPGSPVLNALNSAGNTARESVAVPHRVGLVFAARDWWVGAPFVAGAPHLQYWGHASVATAIVFLGYIEAYFNYPNFLPHDPVAVTIRNQARSVISDLLVYNAVWCAATTDRPDCSVSTDGVVPTESQYFPGDAANVGYYGPAHITQKQASEPFIFDALTSRLGLKTRGAGGGGGGGGGGAPQSTLTAGERLYPDTEIRSPGGAYALRYQSDGNLVLYGPDGAVWASDTAGQGGLHCEMQPDGNFVIYHASGADPWESGTAGLPGAELRVQDDGYIVIYDAGQNVPWWAPR